MDGSVLATLWGTDLYNAYEIHVIFDLKQISSRRRASELYSVAVAVLAVTTK